MSKFKVHSSKKSDPLYQPIPIDDGRTLINMGRGKILINESHMMLYSIYIPLNYNNGCAIPVERLESAHTLIMNLAGGSTQLPTSKGRWMDKHKRVFQDWVTPVLVVVSADPTTVRLFDQLTEKLTTLLEQHEIFIHSVPVVVRQVQAEERFAFTNGAKD